MEDKQHGNSSRLNVDWPLVSIDPKNVKFPCCIVWTPLPIVSWLVPFMGRVGICKEDGTIANFSGLTPDNFAFDSVARYLQLDQEQCCFPPNMTAHKCKHQFAHFEFGSSISWDDALQSSVRHFECRAFNFFTCNCHSFVANCLKRLCYGGSMSWNVVDIAALVIFKAKWVDKVSILKSFLPFTVMACLGVYVVGWMFLFGLFVFPFLLIVWFLLGTYCFKGLLEEF